MFPSVPGNIMMLPRNVVYVVSPSGQYHDIVRESGTNAVILHSKMCTIHALFAYMLRLYCECIVLTNLVITTEIQYICVCI